MQIARVVIVRVIVDGVLGVTVVLIGHDEVLVIYVDIFVVILCNWRCTLYSNGLTHISQVVQQRPLTLPSRFRSTGPVIVIDCLIRAVHRLRIVGLA